MALGEREDFRPGDRASVDLGYRHPLNERLAALLQLNLLYRNRDSGAQAEPGDSGDHFASSARGSATTLAVTRSSVVSFRWRSTSTSTAFS
jgi:hypothetical protein